MKNNLTEITTDPFLDIVKDTVHWITLDGQTATVQQQIEQLNVRIWALHFDFSLDSPLRFDVNVRIPPGTENACVILNGQLLISPFNGEWPVDAPALHLTKCQQQGAAVSTIRPGEFQTINFRWHAGDRLTFYLIFK